MKRKIKNICFAAFCMAFISLVIYSISSVGAVSKTNHSYEKASERLFAEPEVRADSLYFNTLSSRCQYVYDVLKETVAKGKQYTELMPLVLSEGELSAVVRALTYDDPSLYYVNAAAFDLKNHGYTESAKRSGRLVVLPSIVDDRYTRIWIPYTANDSDSSKFLEKSQSRFKASLKKADEMVADVRDVFLASQLIHDYLCGICEKTESGGVYADTAYGALVEGKATSLGYAKAFKLLFDRYFGVSFIVNGGKDYWNAALINDNYYNIDVYGDDLDDMLGEIELRGVTSHLYLCRDDATFYLEHEKGVESVPVCSDKTTYYSHNGFDPSTPSELYDAVKRQVETQRKTKNYYFEIYTELDGAEGRIREATLRALSEDYPDYADSVQIYRLSDNIPVFVVRMVRSAAPREE